MSLVSEKGQRMINFIDGLHRRYKILAKLTDKQCQAFNSEVILLLVDENQNVDGKLHKQVVENIGMDAFVLEVLQKSINRSPFSNAYEMKKNIGSITENLEHQTKELNKKMKIIQRREQQLNQKDNQLKNKIKQYVVQLQKDCLNKLVNKQNQIKKTLNSLIAVLKSKEKVICQRRDEIMLKINEITNREKKLTAKQRQFAKKNIINQSQFTQESVENSSKLIVSKQLKQINKKVIQANLRAEQFKSELQRLKKKYKTTEMAYSKVKNDISIRDRKIEDLHEQLQKLEDGGVKQIKELKQWSAQKQKQKQVLRNQDERSLENKKVNQKDFLTMLNMLEISQIQFENQNSQSQSILKKNMPQYEVKLEINKGSAPTMNIIDQYYENEIHTLSNPLQPKLHDKDDKIVYRKETLTKNKTFIKAKIKNEDEDEEIPAFLKDKLFGEHPSEICEAIQEIMENEKQPSPKVMKSKKLLNFSKFPFYQHSSKVLCQFFDIVLGMVQQSNPHYYELIHHLSASQFTNFLQQAYLAYETHLDIAQATTLLLSRVVITTSVQIQFLPHFIEAVQLRCKVNQSGQNDQYNFLRSNIHCLLSMVHT